MSKGNMTQVPHDWKKEGASELTLYQKQENAIAALLDIGQRYDSIKGVLLNNSAE